ncbi:MAG: thrombospondin type 3 repeat-containing protein [Phycisphaerales bacterium]|nr:thrombospondin type 3 repeat-containing protein [Phycisphaerales bacterium]
MSRRLKARLCFSSMAALCFAAAGTAHAIAAAAPARSEGGVGFIMVKGIALPIDASLIQREMARDVRAAKVLAPSGVGALRGRLEPASEKLVGKTIAAVPTPPPTKPTAAPVRSELPIAFKAIENGKHGPVILPPPVENPADVLYDALGVPSCAWGAVGNAWAGAGCFGSTSDMQACDDFVLTGPTDITQVTGVFDSCFGVCPPTVYIAIYADAGCTPDNAPYCAYDDVPVTYCSGGFPNTITADLPSPCTLSAGRWWIDIQPKDLGGGADWYWQYAAASPTCSGNEDCEVHIRDGLRANTGYGVSYWYPSSAYWGVRLTLATQVVGTPSGGGGCGALVFDQGPNTGSNGGCWSNYTDGQNFAERFSFASTITVEQLLSWSCINTSGTMHIKILDDIGGSPGNYLYEVDMSPDSVVYDNGQYKYTYTLPTPFSATGGATYWIGVSGNGFELGQTSVFTPGDGAMAQFSGRSFSFHTAVGDMMFQLVGCSCQPGDDSDGDGVDNCEDNCPNDYNPDQSDRDGDGLGDVCDGCPDDPNKTEPGVCGCGVADDDRDGDGTPDCNDGCPDDPSKIEPGVCGCGTPDTDRDGDGYADCIDGCPDNPDLQEPGPCGCLRGEAVYDIPRDQLDNLFNDCGNDSLYNCSTPVGFHWTDTGNTTPTFVTLELNLGVDCHGGYSFTTTLNGNPDASFQDNNYYCDCNVRTEIISLNLSSANYNVGGTNYFLVTNLNNCLGFCPTGALGNAYARVHVGRPLDESDGDGDGILGCVDNCPDAYNPGQEDSDGDGTGDVCDDTPCGGGGGGRALVLWADNDDAGLQSYLSGDGRFSLVDAIDARSYTPSLSELQNYDAVITWSNYCYADGYTLGNNLRDYVDQGGGVVIATFAHYADGSCLGPGGGWLSDQYDPILNSFNVSGGAPSIGTVDDPGHPIMSGVSDVQPGYYFYGTSLSGGASAVFHWDNGEIGCAVKTVGSGKTVALNLEPYFDTGAHRDVLIANAMAWAAGESGPGDTDGDGVCDNVDNCVDVYNPDQADRDGDGVGDACDECPDDPYKTGPGVCGCGVPDTDTDGDGTADCIDGCPDDPNKTEPGVCGCGVPEGGTFTYDMQFANLLDASCDCGTGSYYNCCAGANPGFGWVDTSGAAPLSVVVEINTGVDCTGTGTHDVYLNGINQGPIGASFWCDCNVRTYLQSISINPADYVVNGYNEVRLADGNLSCLGFSQTGDLGGAFGRITVTVDNDRDGDGTPDCVDGCPDDPGKTEPGVCGCGVPDTDTDGDGTADCNDGCPDDPNKTDAGICGCGVPDTDTDGDGTADCNDGCPEDPNKIEPGVCGCGVPDTDTDGDGTADCNDGCPEDPNKTEPGVCGCGVPDTDTDGDGVADCEDNCPDVFNPGQEDSDGDGIGDACDEPGDCTGLEYLQMRCKLNTDNTITVISKLYNGVPNNTATFRLDSNPNTDVMKSINANGRAKVKYFSIPIGRHFVAMIECGVEASITCGPQP